MQSPALRQEEPQAGAWQSREQLSGKALGVWWEASWAPTSSMPDCKGDHSILGCVDESMTISGKGIICLYSAILRPLLDTPVIPPAPHSPQCRRNIRNLEWVQCWGTTTIRPGAFVLWGEDEGPGLIQAWEEVVLEGLSWSQFLHSGEWWEDERHVSTQSLVLSVKNTKKNNLVLTGSVKSWSHTHLIHALWNHLLFAGMNKRTNVGTDERLIQSLS